MANQHRNKRAVSTSILRRAVGSLQRRGWAGTADTLLTISTERLFDWRYGTETLAHAELAGLDILSANKAQGLSYVPTRVRPLRRLFHALKLPRTGAFIDYGCGKGRVLMLAAEYGFPRVVGVEFSPALAAIARRNIAAFTLKRLRLGDIEIIENDAARYVVPDDAGVFYFFAPFTEMIMSAVLDNIGHSLARQPRTAFILFQEIMSPPDTAELSRRVHGVVGNTGRFHLLARHVISSNGFVVYRT